MVNVHIPTPKLQEDYLVKIKYRYKFEKLNRYEYNNRLVWRFKKVFFKKRRYKYWFLPINRFLKNFVQYKRKKIKFLFWLFIMRRAFFQRKLWLKRLLINVLYDFWKWQACVNTLKAKRIVSAKKKTFIIVRKTLSNLFLTCVYNLNPATTDVKVMVSFGKTKINTAKKRKSPDVMRDLLKIFLSKMEAYKIRKISCVYWYQKKLRRRWRWQLLRFFREKRIRIRKFIIFNIKAHNGVRSSKIRRK